MKRLRRKKKRAVKKTRKVMVKKELLAEQSQRSDQIRRLIEIGKQKGFLTY